MGKDAHDMVTEIETSPSAPPPARRKPGPKPGARARRQAQTTNGAEPRNGHGARPVSPPALIAPVVARLVEELAAIDAAGARVRAALKTLRA